MKKKSSQDQSRELEELQDPDEWDWSASEASPGVKKARAVVSVAFSRVDFDRLSELAERLQMPLSAFIRAATLEKLDEESHTAKVYLDTNVLLDATFANQYLTTKFIPSGSSPTNLRPDASTTEGGRRGQFVPST